MISMSKTIFFIVFIILVCSFFNITEISLGKNDLIINDNEMEWHLDRISIRGAWEITIGSPDIIVAVIDSGIDFSHPELIDAQWINKDEKPDNGKDDDNNGYIDDRYGYDFYYDDNVPGPDGTILIHGHATYIAGILAAKMDGEGVVGVAPHVKMMNLQIMDKFLFGTSANLAKAIHYAVDNGADVLNFNLELYENTTELQEAIQYAYEHNIIMIAETGGFGYRNRRVPPCEHIEIPGAYEHVIVVVPTDFGDEIADCSNWGEGIEIAAPGGDLNDDFEDWITSTYTSSTYGELQGIAQIPQVSGIIALMKSLNKSITLEQVREILHSTAIDLGDPGLDIYYGYGMLNATAAILEAAKIAEPRRTGNSLIPVIIPLILGVIVLSLKKKRKSDF